MHSAAALRRILPSTHCLCGMFRHLCLPIALPGLLSAALALSAAGAALAAPVTFDEASDAGGDFAGLLDPATPVGAGFDRIVGQRGGTERYDHFALTDLAPGAQSLDLTFAPVTALGPTEFGYNAGGAVFWKTSPFLWESDGTLAGTFNLSFFGNRSQTMTVTLPASYDGSDLHLVAIYYNGTNVGFTADVPSNALIAPPAVPVPAALPLAATGFGALALVTLRRRRDGRAARK
jgi:hypothetical protein